MLRVARFLRGYARPGRAPVSTSEVLLTGTDESFPATLLQPESGPPYPAWILLHGITWAGRKHPLLMRFATAVAASGSTVVIPEVGSWRELHLDEAAGNRAIAASVGHLRQRDDLTGHVTLAGFSFGATQALISATRPGIREHVQRVIGFGGYCDLGRTLIGMMTGEHEWQRVRYQYEPDPYGRWVVAANYIDRIPEFSGMEGLRNAARELAIEAGRRGVYAADAEYDDVKRRLRERLTPPEREVWELIAPPYGTTPPIEPTRTLADRIAAVATRLSPGLDPRPILPLLDQEILLAHGRDDRLIPFTETLRLAAALPGEVNATATITRLFAHSREADRLSVLAWPREAARYLDLLRRAVDPPSP